MSRSMKVLLVVTSVMLSTSCGGTSNSIRGAAYCVKDYATQKMKIDISQGTKKTKLNPEDSLLEVPTGGYKFDNAEFFIDDPDREIIMHVAIEPKENGDATISLLCVGGTFDGKSPDKGISPAMNPFVVMLPVAGNFSVDENKNSQLALGSITIDYRPKPGQAALTARYTVEDKVENGHLKDIYEAYEESNQYLYQFANNNLELRSSFKVLKGDERNSTVVKQSVVGLVRFEKVQDPETAEL